jgi:hypothetical protein
MSFRNLSQAIEASRHEHSRNFRNELDIVEVDAAFQSEKTGSTPVGTAKNARSQIRDRVAIGWLAVSMSPEIQAGRAQGPKKARDERVQDSRGIDVAMKKQNFKSPVPF